MSMEVNYVLEALRDKNSIRQKLQVLKDLGLGYLTLGEATPSLSGDEAQRLKLASEMGRKQEDTIVVFDEPTIGFHPLDVQTLFMIFQKLIKNSATVILIEHVLDVIEMLTIYLIWA
jgi:excinuclease ABC subunit A